MNNSEILFIYEAKECNPNGDPDDENRPRIDPSTGINYVTDLRLKRYFRDYLIWKDGEDKVYVSKQGGKTVSSSERAKFFKSREKLLESCLDARLFGLVAAVKDTPYSVVGPVQFTWGKSFNKVELVPFPRITSTFQGQEKESGEAHGTMGMDWRVYYSLIGFYGVVSGFRAEAAKLQEEDVNRLDTELFDALITQTKTRSKFGHYPHLYLRVEYNTNDYFLGDLRKFVKCTENPPVRSSDDLTLDFSELLEKFLEIKDKISSVKIMDSGKIGVNQGKTVTQQIQEAFPGKTTILHKEDNKTPSQP